MLTGGFDFLRVIGAYQKGGDQPRFVASGKGLADEPTFAFGELVAEKTRRQQWKWVVHRPVNVRKKPSPERRLDWSFKGKV